MILKVKDRWHDRKISIKWEKKNGKRLSPVLRGTLRALQCRMCDVTLGGCVRVWSGHEWGHARCVYEFLSLIML